MGCLNLSAEVFANFRKHIALGERPETGRGLVDGLNLRTRTTTRNMGAPGLDFETWETTGSAIRQFESESVGKLMTAARGRFSPLFIC
jgi:hypothetical protein